MSSLQSQNAPESTNVGSKNATSPMAVKGVDYPYPLDFLRKSTVDDVLSLSQKSSHLRNLISVSPSTSLEDTFQCMATNNIYSVLVEASQPSEKSEGKKFSCFVSIFDLLSATIFQEFFDAASQTKEPTPYDLQQKVAKFMKNHVSTVIGLTSEDRELHEVALSTSVLNLMNMMKRGIHYVLVLDKNGSQSDARILTQFDLVQWLYHHNNHFGSLAEMTIDGVMQSAMEFKSEQDPNQPVRLPGSRWSGSLMKYALSISKQCSALTAFRTMYMHRISGLAVVDENEKLIDNLSASDLRGLTMETLESVNLPVLEYLKFRREKLRKVKNISGVAKVNSRTSNMGEALQLCHKYRLHRIWVVDEDDKPVSVVTLSDFIAAFCPNAGDVESLSEE